MVIFCAQVEWPVLFPSALWRKYKPFLWISNTDSAKFYA